MGLLQEAHVKPAAGTLARNPSSPFLVLYLNPETPPAIHKKVELNKRMEILILLSY